ncbi:XRE family transcriptional regulator [Exiguobacterium sp. SH31]|uniref:LexA family protein n=1 Tax=Exiguobacterium sp. SH31 TaxID=1843183 RepID=UPI000A027A92|nr:XRE family transcriptional regulator [Exiguobacterium sp. SH31]
MYDFNNIRESVGKKIKDKRTSFDLTQEQLAEKLGVSKGSISSWEKGRTAPRMDKVSQMAEIFNVPWSYFVSESEETSLSTPLPPDAITRITASNYKIPVYGSISAGIPLEAIENLTETSVPDHVILKHGEDKLFGLLVRGDSMNKIVHDGHYAILCKTDRVESGEVAAVIVNGYDATLKRVMLLDRGVLLEPSSYNPEHTPKMYLDQEAKDIKVIGKLVAVMSPPDFKF